MAIDILSSIDVLWKQWNQLVGGNFNPKKHGKSQMLTLSRQFANYCQKEFWNISKILSVLVAPYCFLSLYDGILWLWLWLWWRDILPKMCDWVREKIRLGGNFAFQKRMLSERKMEGVECDFNSKLWENINIDIKVEGVKYNFNSKPGESHYDNSVSMVWKEPWNYLKLRALRHIKQQTWI